jgi:hypothetical protein
MVVVLNQGWFFSPRTVDHMRKYIIISYRVEVRDTAQSYNPQDNPSKYIIIWPKMSIVPRLRDTVLWVMLKLLILPLIRVC